MALIRRVVVLIAIICGAAYSDTLPSKYHTFAGAVSELQALVAANPSICKLDSIGYSHRDSLPFYQFKISDNVVTDEDEPAIFFNGGVHADEVLGVEVVLNFCHDIIAKYNSGDTAIQRYINSYEIFVFPFLNPEGHVAVEDGDLDWRKNKADNNNNGLFDFHDGVDCNRNFDFGWNIDDGLAATTPESLMYKGPFPFSEPECVAVRDAGMKYKPIIAVDYHAPTYGLGEVAYYCWYWYATEGGHGFAPDEVSMYHIGVGFAASIVNDRGDSTYQARRALVNKGDYKTFFYGNFGTAAMVCEISDTTIQDTSMVDSICRRHLPGMYYLLGRAGYARLTGVVTDSLTGQPLDATVEVLEATSLDINPRHTKPNTGRYDRLIDPGTYTLRFQKTGYTTKTVNMVTVNNSGPTVRNVQLASQSIPPQAPVLVSPANGTSFVDSVALNFDWNDVPTATRYIIEIARDSSFADIFQFDSLLTASNYRNTISFTPSRYYWRVTAHNIFGYSPCSTKSWFDILEGSPPAVPILLLPLNGSTPGTPRPLCDWNNSAGATGYIFEIDTDSLFDPPVEVDSNIIPSQYQIVDSLMNDRYFWRVTAFNGHGFSARSAIWHFDINIGDLPAIPSLILPAVGFISDSAYVNFDWSDISGAIRYAIQIDNDSLFNSPAISDTSIISSNYRNIDSLTNSNYYWHVKARNDIGWSAYSPSRSFNVQVDTAIFYLVGDVNHSGAVNGLDVTYLVNFFKGGTPPPLNIDGLYVEADANGSCTVNGLDVTYLVNYFKGGPSLIDGHCIH